VGGRRSGKPGRGAEGKRPVLVACEAQEERAGFVAIQRLTRLNKEAVRAFAGWRLRGSQTVLTDALPALNSLAEAHDHLPQATPPYLADAWLPWVHIVISHLKRFLLGTFHGVSHTYLQEYLNEFCYRFNRRFRETEIPNRLLRLCVEHAPVKLT
jgi:hypothetical protein